MEVHFRGKSSKRKSIRKLTVSFRVTRAGWSATAERKSKYKIANATRDSDFASSYRRKRTPGKEFLKKNSEESWTNWTKYCFGKIIAFSRHTFSYCTIALFILATESDPQGRTVSLLCYAIRLRPVTDTVYPFNLQALNHNRYCVAYTRILSALKCLLHTFLTYGSTRTISRITILLWSMHTHRQYPNTVILIYTQECDIRTAFLKYIMRSI